MIKTMRVALAAGLLVSLVPAAWGEIGDGGSPREWPTTGGSWAEQHYSPLGQINADTVSDLGLAWYADLGTDRGQEATPLVVGNVLYNAEPWNIVTAYNAATGEPLWR